MSQKDLEPYQPNFSAASEPTRRAEESYREGRRSGCMERALVYSVTMIVFACILVAGMAMFSVGVIGDSLSEFCIYDCDTDVVEVDVQPFILALKQEAFLETLRSEQVYEIYASNEMPGIIPGRRSMRYKAFMTITGGVDLQLVEEADFSSDGTSITITLPKPQLRDCVLDSQTSFFYEESCNYVGCGNLEEVLVDRAYEMPVSEGYEILLTEAWENAVEAVTDMAQNFGYEIINIQQTSEEMFFVSNDSTCKIPADFATPQPTAAP